MAQPHQYHGEGGAAPVWPGEGATSYRDSYRPDPFLVGLHLTPGCDVDVERDTIMRFTQADGTVRQTFRVPLQSLHLNTLNTVGPQTTNYGCNSSSNY